FASSDVGNPHAGADAGELHHLLGLAHPVAGVLGRKGVAHNGRHVTLRLRKPRLLRLLSAG
ncbi:MAG TPA: hypothetical protein VE820_05815, partial [Sphingomicrobium sp.]|nr:hypothetical protein [Sphingomicrobium sp.]